MKNPLNKLEWYASNFLGTLREHITAENLDREKVPLWASCTSIRYGVLNGNSAVFVLESARDKDLYTDVGDHKADASVLFNCQAFVPDSFFFGDSMAEQTPGEEPDLMTISKIDYDKLNRGAATLLMRDGQALTMAGYYPPYRGFTCFDLVIQQEASDETITAVRYVPAAIIIHQTHLERWVESVRAEMVARFMKQIRLHHDGEAGQFRKRIKQHRANEFTSYLATKQNTVILLGKDTENAGERLRQLNQSFVARKYDSHLIKDYPENAFTSNLEKVKILTSAARFVVMVDEEPSGHLTEYPAIKEHCVLALLRRVNSGTTYMIGDDDRPDIKIFYYNEHALETVDDVITWAEDRILDKGKHYSGMYPWRP